MFFVLRAFWSGVVPLMVLLAEGAAATDYVAQAQASRNSALASAANMCNVDASLIHSAAVWTVPPQITHVNGVTLGGNHLLLPFGVTLFGYQHTYQNT